MRVPSVPYTSRVTGAETEVVVTIKQGFC